MNTLSHERLWQQIARTQFERSRDGQHAPMLLHARIATPPAGWSSTVNTAAGRVHLAAANSVTELRYHLATWHVQQQPEQKHEGAEQATDPAAGLVIFVADALAGAVPADILARVRGGQVRPAGREDALLASFRASRIAPDLSNNAELMDTLLNEGITGQVNGELSERFALQTLWQTLVGAGADPSGAPSSTAARLLEHAMPAHAMFQRLPTKVVEPLRRIALEDIGPVAHLFFNWVRRPEPRCAFLPLLIATDACHRAVRAGSIPPTRWISLAGALWSAVEPGELELASAADTLKKWAEEIAAHRPSAEQTAEKQAMQELVYAGAEQLIAYSSITRSGWTGALTRTNLSLLQALAMTRTAMEMGSELATSAASESIAAAGRSIDELAEHFVATNNHDLAGVSDAKRTMARCHDLLAGLRALLAHDATVRTASEALSTDPSITLDTLARFQMLEGRFLDAARERMERHALPEALQQARTAIVAACRLAANHRNRLFAEAYARLAPDDAMPLTTLRQEHVIEQVVAPLLRAQHTLLWIVMDGMSWSVAQDLLPDIVHTMDATCMIPAASGKQRPMLAMVPTITALARTTLLTGQRTWGDQNTEKKDLPANWQLQQAHPTPPQIFHRAAVGQAGSDLADVSSAVLSRTGLVTVVVNAVDEALGGSAQHTAEWTLTTLPALKRLLELAKQAGRSVILAADHGSVWATSADTDNATLALQDARLQEALDNNTRTTPSGLANPTRVVRHSRYERTEDGTLTMAISDAHFFKNVGTAGTHGGLTLQEVVAPLLLIADADRVPASAWLPLDLTEPAWMRASTKEPPAAPVATRPAQEVLPEPAAVPRKRRPTVTEAPAPQVSLPGIEPAAAPVVSMGVAVPDPTTWGAALLKSPTFTARMVGRINGQRDTRYLHALLAALEAGGHRCSLAQVAGPLGRDESSVRHFVSKAMQLFNVDGYSILTLELATGIVKVDSELLRSQFGV